MYKNPLEIPSPKSSLRPSSSASRISTALRSFRRCSSDSSATTALSCCDVASAKLLEAPEPMAKPRFHHQRVRVVGGFDPISRGCLWIFMTFDGTWMGGSWNVMAILTKFDCGIFPLVSSGHGRNLATPGWDWSLGHWSWRSWIASVKIREIHGWCGKSRGQ